MLCEKPMANTVESCEAMIAAAKEADRKLMIAYRAHFEPHNLKAKEMMDAGEFGAVNFIDAYTHRPLDVSRPRDQWRIRRELAGGGSMPDIGIYALNGVMFYLGETPSSLTAQVHSPDGDPRFAEIEDVCAVQARFPSGAVAHMSSSYTTGANRISIFGDKALATLSPATAYHDNRLAVTEGLTTREIGTAAQSDVQFHREMDHLSEAVKNGTDVRTPGEMGLRDMRDDRGHLPRRNNGRARGAGRERADERLASQFQPRLRTDARPQPFHVAAREGHAAFGGRVAGAGEVDEDGGAAPAQAPADARAVVVRHEHHVVEVVVAPEPLAARGVGERKRRGCSCGRPTRRTSRRGGRPSRKAVARFARARPAARKPLGNGRCPAASLRRPRASGAPCRRGRARRASCGRRPQASLASRGPVGGAPRSRKTHRFLIGAGRRRVVSVVARSQISRVASVSRGRPHPSVLGKAFMTARTLLIVDDDDDLRDGLTEQLSLYEEFQLVTAENAAKGMAEAKSNHVDCLIMDVGLPDMDGREAVKLLRKGGFTAPIIMLTGHDTDSDTILGLEAGANDYVPKPFKIAVLLARIRAQLRQHEQSEDATFTVGPYSFRPAQKLMVDDPDGAQPKKVRLTEKETAILRYLYKADQKVVTRDVLLGRGVGLQFGRHDAHAGNPHLPPAPEDRARAVQRAALGDGGGWVQAGAVSVAQCASLTAWFDRARLRETLVAFRGETSRPCCEGAVRGTKTEPTNSFTFPINSMAPRSRRKARLRFPTSESG